MDDALVKNRFQAEEDLFEMNNGCICCTVRVDLITILMKLMKRKKDGGRLDHIQLRAEARHVCRVNAEIAANINRVASRRGEWAM